MQKIILIGFGTVGQGLCKILLEKASDLEQDYDYQPRIVGIVDARFGSLYDPAGLDLRACLDQAASGRFVDGVEEMGAAQFIRETDADVVCELAYTNLETGEPAISHCRAAFESGKHVVTSNKGPAALAYRELMELAEAHEVEFLIEGTVMSGTPVLNLVEGPLAGNFIRAAKGILNGTTNYILTRMEEGMEYAAALEQAQVLGYAEADPTGDVEGHDARAKVTILANVVMGADVRITDVACEGISQLGSADIEKARQQNARWKLIGSVEMSEDGIAAEVRPEMVPLTHPLASIMEATNALTLTTDLLGDVTIVGPGAGRRETGFSILTDLLTLEGISYEE